MTADTPAYPEGLVTAGEAKGLGRFTTPAPWFFATDPNEFGGDRAWMTVQTGNPRPGQGFVLMTPGDEMVEGIDEAADARLAAAAPALRNTVIWLWGEVDRLAAESTELRRRVTSLENPYEAWCAALSAEIEEASDE